MTSEGNPSDPNTVITTLEDAQQMIEQLQKKLKAQSCQFLAWNRKFKMQEDIIAQIVRQRNDQMKSLSLRLILFEAKLCRKQNEITTLLAERETVITRQEKIIKMLQSQLKDAIFKCANQRVFDTSNDSDSAIIMDDEENYPNNLPTNTEGATIERSISDVIPQPNSHKIYNMRKMNGYLRRPEVLQTVYSVEEDTDVHDGGSEIPHIYRRHRLSHACILNGADDKAQTESSAPVSGFSRVTSTNHRSVTKPKDIKNKRINKAKSKSLEELRGRLKNWVGKTIRLER